MAVAKQNIGQPSASAKTPAGATRTFGEKAKHHTLSVAKLAAKAYLRPVADLFGIDDCNRHRLQVIVQRLGQPECLPAFRHVRLLPAAHTTVDH